MIYNYNPNLLLCFISCQKYKKRWDRIIKMCSDIKIQNYNIFIGGDTFKKKGRIIQLPCKDNYEDLPEKVFMIYNLISKSFLKSYNYFWKLDDDIEILRFDNNLKMDLFKTLNGIDYCGFRVIKQEGNREWHFGKCSKSSTWNNKPYKGNYPNWAEGGNSYFLSQKAVQYFRDFDQFENLRKSHIYEDVAVAEKLLSHGIQPTESSPWTNKHVLEKDLYLK